MKTSRNKYLLCNWLFVVPLIILLLNDYYFKTFFHNWVTGKLSDFAGLLIFPMFLQFLFPRLNGRAALVTGVIFVLWKSPVSEPFIDFYNSFSFFRIDRVVDYTDFVALLVLPFSHVVMQSAEKPEGHTFLITRLNPLWLVIPSSFVFMATTNPCLRFLRPDGDIYIGRSYKIKMPKEEVIQKLRAKGYNLVLDSTDKWMDHYLIEHVIIGADTINSIRLFLYEYDDAKTCKLGIETINEQGKQKLNDWRILKKYSKYYDRLIKSTIVEEVR